MTEPAGPLVLLIDDERQIHRFLRPALEAAGYRTVSAMNGTEGLRLAATRAPQLVLLDLGLPDLDGRVVLSRLRGFSTVPVIVLSAREGEAERITLLDAGADDYVGKPFGLGELLARLRVALRRTDAAAEAPDAVLAVGPVMLDPGRHEVTVAGERVVLSPREFRLLAMLMRHRDRVLTHRQILVALWGPAHAEDVQYLRVYIGQLRQKLGAVVARMIVTEPNVGYRLAPPPVANLG